jgi:hypothetical protein
MVDDDEEEWSMGELGVNVVTVDNKGDVSVVFTNNNIVQFFLVLCRHRI